jgi:hypothetical protein
VPLRFLIKNVSTVPTTPTTPTSCITGPVFLVGFWIVLLCKSKC